MEGQSREEYIGSLRRFLITFNNYNSKKFNCVKLISWWDEFYNFIYIISLLIYRKSSGFSRGVSKYRGVARYDLIQLNTSICFILSALSLVSQL